MNIKVTGAGFAIVNGIYRSKSFHNVPNGFAVTCNKMGWPPEPTWKKLATRDVDWFESSNGSYIYLHTDGQWWIDEPNGGGIYIANAIPPGNSKYPPRDGWKPLSQGTEPLPIVEPVADDE